MNPKGYKSLILSFLESNSRIHSPKSTSSHFHSKSSFTHQTPIQNITKLDDAYKLFDEMSQRTPLPSVVKFNMLLNAVTNMNHYSCSINLFKQMGVVHIPFDTYTINIVIKCCCKLNYTNSGFAVLGFAFKHAVAPDVCTFNTLLNGLVVEVRILEVELLFKKLVKQELCEPDVVMYSTVIKGLCKIGNNAIAMNLLKLMSKTGCKPSVFTYNTIIDSLCKDKQVDDALKMFNRMIFKERVPPDIVTYTSLIHGFCILGRWGEVSRMLKEMEGKMISPNVRTFSILVDSLSKEGRVEDVESVIGLMIKRGVDIDVIIYNSLLDVYCLRGEMIKAREVFDLIAFRGLTPDLVTYNSLLNGY
ncbi:pentatricopeptide repeat-containing protein DOT4, chloroplastic-like [Bidens hawaiensis]|uniref:pentatricopeptide repeat-containing protein DOT4, chloroplastic-like n=1 Tax=Bidens hawaiensis TaxID=980011 RepID=UPI004048FD6C